jgi:hypothetical protein
MIKLRSMCLVAGVLCAAGGALAADGVLINGPGHRGDAMKLGDKIFADLEKAYAAQNVRRAAAGSRSLLP